MKELRPLGSLIQQEFPPDLYSISPNSHMKSRITYKIVDYVKVVRFLEDLEGVLSEELEAQYIEYWNGKEWVMDEGGVKQYVIL